MTLRSIRRVQQGSVAVLSLLIVAGLVALGRFAPSTGESAEPERAGSVRFGQLVSPGVHALAAGSTLVCVPTSAHSPGANGAVWRTDLEVHNPGSVQASYTIALLKRDTDNTNPTKVSYTLGPGLSQRYGDVVNTLFSFTGGSALQVSVTSGSLLVTSDTYNLLANGSTYGQFVPAMSSSDAITSSDQGRLIQLTHNPSPATSFRTNIGLVNATMTPVGVTVDLFNSQGVELGATQSVTLKGLEFQQWDKVYERVTSQVVVDGYAIVRVTTAGGSVFAYASLVDNRTGDPICIPAQKLAAGPNPPTPTPTVPGPTPTPTRTPTPTPTPTPTATQAATVSADLRLYVPSGWPACVVGHYQDNWTTAVTPFLSTYYDAYIYFNVANYGAGTFASPLEIGLYIDGVYKGTYLWSNGSGLATYTYTTLYLPYTTHDVTAGTHAVRVVLDPNGKLNLANRTGGDCSANLTWSSIVFAPKGVSGAAAANAHGLAEAAEVGRAKVEGTGASAQLVTPSASYIVPTSAHSPGANGAVWRTDLEVHNPGSVQANYSIALLKRDTDNTNGPGVSFTLGPGLSQRYGDVVNTLFSFTGGAALQVSVTSGAVLVTSDTYNLLGNGSTYGQFVPAMSSSDAITSSDQGRLIQLTHDPGGKTSFRTNIGFVNGTTTPVGVTVDLFNAQGVQLGGTQSVTLKGLEFQQWDKAYERVTSQVVADGYAVVRVTTAGGSVFAYASLVDNRTGDPICIPAQKPGSSAAPFVYGTSRTYTAPTVVGGQIQDDVTGFVFQFPQGGSGTLKITKTVSGPGIEPNQVAFKAEYTGQQQVNLVVDAGSAVYARLLGYVDARYVDTLGEVPQGAMGWFGIPDSQTIGSVRTFPMLLPGAARPAAQGLALAADAPAVSDYSVDLNRPPGNTVPPDILAAYNQFSAKKDALASRFLGLFSGAEQNSMSALLTGLHTKVTLIVARNVDPSFYSPYVIHPWLRLVTHEIYLGLKSQSFNHEFGHYLHHILIGDPFLTLPTRSTIFHGHDLGTAGASGVLVEEPAYFTEFFAPYDDSETAGLVNTRINGDWLSSKTADKETADYPDLEGFTSHMLAQVVRRTNPIRPFLPFNGTDANTGWALPIPVPVVQAPGGTNELFHDCYKIISGITTGTTVYDVRDAIEADLEAKGSQGWTLPPILQAIGWNYKVQFQFVDQSGNLLPGFSAHAVIIGPSGERFELPDGHSSLAPSKKTSSGDGDDPYTLDWCYGGGNTVLHINELNRDYPVKVEIPWNKPTNQIVTIPDVIIGPGSRLQLLVYEKPRGSCGAWDDGFSADIVPTWAGTTFQYANTSSHTNAEYGDIFSSDITLNGAVSADRKTLTSLQVSYHFKDAWPTSASCHNGSCDTEEWFTVTLANVPAATDWATAFYHFHAEGAAALAAITGFSNRQIFTNEDCSFDVDPSIPAYTKLDIWLAAPPK